VSREGIRRIVEDRFACHELAVERDPSVQLHIPLCPPVPAIESSSGPSLESIEAIEPHKALPREPQPDTGDLQELVAAGVAVAPALREGER
jgi:hypothetical protein